MNARLLQHLLNVCFGALFGIGLLISGMANPAKVIGFLDVFGQWDPSLAFVMMGAILVAIAPFTLAKQNKFPTFNHTPCQLPTTKKIDTKLIIGSALFGIGWGLSGICPAPSLSLLGLGLWQVLYFVVPMLLTMFLYKKTTKQA